MPDRLLIEHADPSGTVAIHPYDHAQESELDHAQQSDLKKLAGVLVT
jgi:hypothetical protein